MATAVHWRNTDGIDQCGMSRATLEATGRRHWATSCSISPQRPPEQQQTKQQQINGLTLLAIVMATRLHRPMEEVQGFGRSHWTQLSGKYCGQYLQSVTYTLIFLSFFIVNL
jgi:hypothetical protein